MGLIFDIVDGIMGARKAVKQKNAEKDDSVNSVTVENRYSIDVPSFLSPTNKLSADAALQYWNKTLDISFQVIDEPKFEFVESIQELREEDPDFGKGETLLDMMSSVCLNTIFDDIDKVEIGNYENTTINGLPAVTLNAFQKRTFFKDALYGSFAFIEGRETLYQVMIFSGGESIEKLADKLERSIKSFKEL